MNTEAPLTFGDPDVICKMEGGEQQLDAEVCEEKVMETLPELSATELENLCLELALTVPPGTKDSNGRPKRTKMFKFVMKYLVDLESDNEDGGKAKMVQIFQYFKSNSYISSDENKAVPEEKTEEVTEEKAPASTKQIDQNALLLEMAKLLVGNGGLGAALPSSPANSSAKLKPAMVMKDLKLDGVIGAEGEKNKMSFTSLCYQIRNAQKLGHSEAAICNAILIAISPTNNLRTFFEMRPQLTVNTMLSKLKNLYKEKDSTDTLIELGKAVQLTTETPFDFGTRLMNQRNKILMLAETEGCPQNPVSISRTLLKSFFMGIRNGNVRNELRESCKHLYKKEVDADKDDDVFLDLISEAMSNETDRNTRLSEAKKADVLVMQSNITNKETAKSLSFKEMKEAVKKEMSNPLSEIECLKVEQVNQGEMLASVMAQLNEIKNAVVSDRSSPSPVAHTTHNTQQPMPLMSTNFHNTPPPPPQMHNQNQQQSFPVQPNQVYVPPHRRKCANCERENRFRCFHCFHCGSSAHQIGTCPTKNE